jgi:hypothetical protein
MGEIGEFIIFILLTIVAIIAAVISAAILAAVISFLTIYYTFWFPIVYFISIREILASPCPSADPRESSHEPAAHPRTHVDQLVASPSYFFGPASMDLKLTFGKAAGHCIELVTSRWRSITRKYKIDKMPGFLFIVGTRGSLLTGILAGGATIAVVAAVHLVVTAAANTTAASAAVLVRGMDRFNRFMRSVRMSCPSCSETVYPYPAYRCPHCDEVHRDIRSGPYGVFTRICTCGYRMPTSLLTGAGRLVAACPSCEIPLPSKFGTVGEIVIPFFGSNNVGKTQLMYNVILSINELVSKRGGTVEVDNETRLRLEAIGADLANIGKPSRTLPQIPQANVLYIRLGAIKRLIYLFDAAGEIYSRQSNVAGVRYLNVAHTLVFVADPLASDHIWGQLSSRQQEKLTAVRSKASEIVQAYEVTGEHMRAMARRRRFRLGRHAPSLAFVISKADLLNGTTAAPLMSSESLRQLVRDEHGLDLGDLAREAEQRFSMVKYFQASAITGDASASDKSVTAVAQWIMWSEDIRLETPHEGA